MDAESKERGRDYLAADIFLTAVRFGGDAAINPVAPGRGPARRAICVYVDGQAHDPVKRAPALAASWCAIKGGPQGAQLEGHFEIP